jgi:hypothetical protein
MSWYPKKIDISTGEALTEAELEYLDNITPGTVAASKAVVVNSSKDAGDFRNLDAVNIDAGASGTAGTVDVFPSTASKGKIVVQCADNTTDHNLILTNAPVDGANKTATIPALTGYVGVSTAALTLAEMDLLDGAGTGGTPVASKVQVADANQNIGAVKATSLSVGASGSEVAVTSTPAEINLSDGIAASAAVSFAAGAANVSNVTVQLKDAAAANLTHSCLVRIWLSDAATGVGLTSHAADTITASTGTVWHVDTAAASLLVQTDATGKAVLVVTDTHKTGFYVACDFANGRAYGVSAQMVAGDYGA